MPLTKESTPGLHNIIRKEYPNGMIVLVKENFSSPSVVVDGLIRASSADDRSGQEGLSAFTTDVLMRGTTQRSFTQIFEEIESVGATVDVSSGINVSSFGAKSLAEDLPLIVDILSDVLRNPTFPVEEIEKVRGEIVTSLEERENDTRRKAGLTFRELLYPQGHPYARSTEGYLDSVRSIGRDDIINFYRSRYGAKGMLVSIVGAVKADHAFKVWEDKFGDWLGATADRSSMPDAPRLTEMREKRVNLPGKTQSDLIMGFIGPRRSAPDYMAARLGNSILGQFGLYGRIGEAVREKGGMAYYSYSQIEGGVGPGSWRMVAGVAPKNVDKAVKLIRDQIKRFIDTKVTARELGDNKSHAIGSMPLGLETNDGVAGVILDMEFYGLGLDYLIRYPDLIKAVTAAQIQAAAQQYLDAKHFALAVAGPQEK